MIKPVTCLTLLFAAGCGLYLYTAKHKVELLDHEIVRLEKVAQDSRARADLLHAQYDLLGDPDRLRELATQVLTLQPTAPGQFTTMAELDRRLPPPGPLPALPAATADPVPAPVAAPLVTSEAAPVAEHVAEKPIDRTIEKPVDRPAEHVAEKPAERPAPPRPAPRPPAPVPAPVVASVAPQRPPAPQPAPRPAPVQQARRAPEPAVTPQAQDSLARTLRSTPVNATVPMVASALGMARAMMAPPLAPAAQTARR